MDKLKQFYNDHKVEIITSVVAVVVGGTVYSVSKAFYESQGASAGIAFGEADGVNWSQIDVLDRKGRRSYFTRELNDELRQDLIKELKDLGKPEKSPKAAA